MAFFVNVFSFQLARLPPEDMNAVNNMRLLEGASDTKKSSLGAFSLKFDVHKVSVIGCFNFLFLLDVYSLKPIISLLALLFFSISEEACC